MITDAQKKALIIGISDYTDPRLKVDGRNLNFCRNDAETIGEELKKLNFDIAEGNMLVGEANWEKVRNTIYDFFVDNEGSPDDTLLFYYSGHGVLDDQGNIYLALSDTDSQKPYIRGYSFGDLAMMIERTISTRVVVILDCCYSGSAKLGKGSEEDAVRKWRSIMEERSKNLQQQQQRHVKCILAASQSHQEAYALKEEEHSVFTKYLLKGLKGEDNESIDNDGNVTPQSLSNYVYIAIKRLPSNERPRQDPIIIPAVMPANIILASYPKLKPKKIEDTLASMLKLLREGNVQEFNKMRETNSAILPEPDLSRGNLHGAHIAGANLSNANLSKADLSEADLERADLSNAYLIRADLDGANLSNTNCTNTIFEAANLSNANLAKANLSNAKLARANLYHARISSEHLQQARTDGAIEIEPPDKKRGQKWILSRKTKISIAVGIATVIAAVLALVLFNQQMLTNEKYALYGKGEALINEGNYTGAIAYFDQALHMDPNFKDALYEKGNALNYIQKTALINQQKLTSEKYTLYEKGDALNGQGDYAGAIRYLDHALAIDPKFEVALYDKGDALNNLGNYTGAIRYLDQALAIDPTNEGALRDKGWALNGLGNYTEAITYLDRTLALGLKDKIALNNKGWALNGLGNYTGAITYLDRALALDQNYVPALTNKGWALNGLGNYTGAITYLDRALALDRSSLYYKLALNNKGWALNGLGNYKEALATLDQALSIDANYELALNNKGWALDGLGNYTGAITYLDKALVKDPDDKYVLKNKGWALDGLGNYTGAITYLDKALSIDPKYNNALFLKQIAQAKLAHVTHNSTSH